MTYRLNKTILQIIVVLGLILLFKPTIIGFETQSTVSYSGITTSQCDAKETTCFDNNGLKGKLLDCYIGSDNKCFCEFRSYSRNECPNGETPKATTSDTTIITSGARPTGEMRDDVIDDTAEREIDIFNDKIGPFKLWWIAIPVVLIILILLFKGGSGYAGLKPTKGTIELGK